MVWLCGMAVWHGYLVGYEKVPAIVALGFCNGTMVWMQFLIDVVGSL